MQFHSYLFIFIFLPLTICTYFLLNRYRCFVVSKVWLVATSLFFYSYLNIRFLPILLCSILFNFFIGKHIAQSNQDRKKFIVTIGVISNIALLCYFKYTNFFITTINSVGNFDIKYFDTILPLGISFFTFQQIAFLVDIYRQKTRESNILDYSLFVSFFPQLLLGPIVLHKELVPQLNNLRNKLFNTNNIVKGAGLFFLGLFKKAIIADTFAIWAVYGFDNVQDLTLITAWITSLAYTFQLYFDFSGYTDMALGAALMLNIKLPDNFNKPYLALNIQDFWRRWHITLSRFIKNYIYIPLGGNRKGTFLSYFNLMAAFLIGGIWHGAGWTFIFWGFLHGMAMVIHRVWQKLGIAMSRFLAWFITFNFVNICWVFFRANNFESALEVLRGMFGLNGIILPSSLMNKLQFLGSYGIEFEQLHITSSSAHIRINHFLFFLFFYLMLTNFSKIIEAGSSLFNAPNEPILIRKSKEFFREYSHWWITPIIFIMLLIGISLTFTEGSAMAPFIYTSF